MTKAGLRPKPAGFSGPDRPTPRAVPAPARPLWSATGSAAVLKVGRQPWPAAVLPHFEDSTVRAGARHGGARFDGGDGPLNRSIALAPTVRPARVELRPSSRGAAGISRNPASKR